MVDTVRFINSENTRIQVYPENWIMPYPSNTWHQIDVDQWVEGRTDEWDENKAAYDDYNVILGHDVCLANPPEEGCPLPPPYMYNGEHYAYNTQEEVDQSLLEWNEWSDCEGNTPGECGEEPLILKRPGDLVAVPEPPPLVPNTILAYDAKYGLSQEDIEQAQNDSMRASGDALTQIDDTRTSVGAPAVIPDRPAHDSWMQQVYQNVDEGITTIPKPPADERQALPIAFEDADPFVFTRYQDQWGWRWRMDLIRDSVNALALYIQDSNGNYLYTTGGLIRNETDDGWYTECPAGQADPTPENVYFKWIMGSAPISGNFVYEGSKEELSGVVRSDSDYD